MNHAAIHGCSYGRVTKGRIVDPFMRFVIEELKAWYWNLTFDICLLACVAVRVASKIEPTGSSRGS